MVKQQINPVQQKNVPSSLTNTGTAGGTMYYINLGGLKILWGQTASLTNTASGTGYTFVFPSGFFTTVQSATTSTNTLNSDARQNINWSALSNTGGTIAIYSPVTTTGELIGYMVIGS